MPVSNGEARDKYLEDYNNAIEYYTRVNNNTDNCNEIISSNRGISQQLEGEINSIQELIDMYTEFLSTCNKLKEDDYEEENNKIKDYSSNFVSAISRSGSSIDIESYYSTNMKKIFNLLDSIIEKLKAMIESLEEKKKGLCSQKETADEAVRNAQTELNNMESKSSISARADESYQWYRYYMNKCEEEGEDADSGLY